MWGRVIFYGLWAAIYTIFSILFFTITIGVKAQQPNFSIDVQAEQHLLIGENIDFNQLFTASGQGNEYYSFEIINEDEPGLLGGLLGSKIEDLYLNIRFYTDEIGTISEIHQVEGQPFSMEKGGILNITNQLLGILLPGVEEEISFEGGLTPAGETFLLNKTTGTLPPARYTIEVQLYQGHNKLSGGNLLATGSTSFVKEIHQPSFSVDVQAEQRLITGENIDFNQLFNALGQGDRYYNFDIINEDSPDFLGIGGGSKIEDLYLNIRFYTAETGTISEIHQVEGQPFSMEKGGSLNIVNQLLGGLLPGIEEQVSFEGGLTPAGETFLLNKTTGTLPPARYTIEVQLYQGHNKLSGGTLLATGSTNFVKEIQPLSFFIDVQADQRLITGENIDFNQLFTASTQGDRYYSFDIINENQPGLDGNLVPLKVEDLYLNIRFFTDEVGTISEIHQVEGQPFSMEKGGSLHIVNQLLGGLLPGIEEPISFEGGLTPAGETFLMGKATGNLPPASYTIEVQLYQGGNKLTGGILLTTGITNFLKEISSTIGLGGDTGGDGGGGSDGDSNGGGSDDGSGGGSDDGSGGGSDDGSGGGSDDGSGGGSGDGDNHGPQRRPEIFGRGDNSAIYLTSPGSINKQTEITNPYPEFRWEGPIGLSYRLIIVKGKEESPESLIQGALSTSPNIVENRPGSGNLLEYEVLDAKLTQTAFQFPASGVQALEQGVKYYWQVVIDNSSTRTSARMPRSEIWSFSLAGWEKSVEYSEELNSILITLLGNERYQELKRDGFRLLSIEVDNKILTGNEALNRLGEIKSEIEQEKISVVNN